MKGYEEGRSLGRKFYIVANWMQGVSLSGGDRIFIELSKRWTPVLEIVFLVSREGWDICRREGLEGFSRRIWASKRFNKYGYFIDYFYRSFNSLFNALRFDVGDAHCVYSSSDFWPDVIPALILKIRKRAVVWIAGFFLFIVPPWHKESPYRGKKWLLGLCYWLSQRPAYWIVKGFADMVFVTSDPDVRYFRTKKRCKERIVVVRGGVDTRPARAYLESATLVPVDQKKYDSCFVGRFHYQKGVLDLVDIWGSVCKKLPKAKLVMIGDGPLVEAVKNKIQRASLGQNIELLGYQDGIGKFEIFKLSKIVLHPAIYDSGGMAAAEAMAWGLPGVSFDLDALKSYYPKGMLKARIGDHKQFSELVLSLLKDKELYKNTSKDAYELIRDSWEWDKRADDILCNVKKLL